MQQRTYIIAMLGIVFCLNACSQTGGMFSAAGTKTIEFRRLIASLGQQRYVPGMPDLPVYDSFKPKGGDNAVYDVAEGRIIDITYESNIADYNKVKEFYDISLSQLGWEAKDKHNTYQRDGEVLTLEVSRVGQTTILHILLQPADR